jgi:predicted NBD/HSP70 family sugar kinase
VEHYVGIDVSLEFSSIYIVDATGTIVKETKAESDPDALSGASAFQSHASGLKRAHCRNGCSQG